MLTRYKNRYDYMTKRVIFFSVFSICFSILFYFILWARYSARITECNGRFFQIRCSLNNYYELYQTYPHFIDKNGTQTWSWRLGFLYGTEYDNIIKDITKNIRTNEPWNSEHNIKIIQTLDGKKFDKNFACSVLYPKDKRASFVAVTGERTAWNEISKGNITPKDYCNMIILIESPKPTHHWAEPGDDMKPEDVIELFKAYKKNKHLTRHPIQFKTFDRTSQTFDDVKDIEDLRNRLFVREF